MDFIEEKNTVKIQSLIFIEYNSRVDIRVMCDCWEKIF